MKEDATPPPVPSSAQPSLIARLNLYWPIATFVLMAFGMWGAIGKGEGGSIIVLWVFPTIVGALLGLLIRLVSKRPYIGPSIAVIVGCAMTFLLWVGSRSVDHHLARFREESLLSAREINERLRSLSGSDPTAPQVGSRWTAAVVQIRRVRTVREDCAELLYRLTKDTEFLNLLGEVNGSQFGAEKAFRDFADDPRVRDLRRALRSRLAELEANQRRLELLIEATNRWSVSADGEIEFSDAVDRAFVDEFNEAQAVYHTAQDAALGLFDER